MAKVTYDFVASGKLRTVSILVRNIGYTLYVSLSSRIWNRSGSSLLCSVEEIHYRNLTGRSGQH